MGRNKKRRREKNGQGPSSIPTIAKSDPKTTSDSILRSNEAKTKEPLHPPPIKDEKPISHNELAQRQKEFLDSLSTVERESFFCDELITPERRAEIWMQQADVGEALVDRYAWATPDDRAVQILRHFAPLIEIGCGANAYWCRLLRSLNIDIVGYDYNPRSGGKISSSRNENAPKGETGDRAFVVHTGGPEVLEDPSHRDRALLLCYPDEDPNATMEIDDEKEGLLSLTMGVACLHFFQGDYIIHVGELFGDTLGAQQAPWGRSSSPEFQQRLAADFHCLLKVSIPNWLHVCDTLSVWKRSKQCIMVFAVGESDGEDDHNEEEEDEELPYRHIPVEERLPTDLAAPCLAHLLSRPNEVPALPGRGKEDLSSPSQKPALDVRGTENIASEGVDSTRKKPKQSAEQDKETELKKSFQEGPVMDEWKSWLEFDKKQNKGAYCCPW
jgi:hypothetical protein